MGKEQKKRLAEINKIDQRVDEKKWNCIIENCSEKSINSHLLQQNGILSNITENGFIIELGRESVFQSQNQKFVFKEKGIKNTNVIALKLFCSQHDNSIFKEIETKPTDFTEYRTQLLLSYRATCAEIRRKEAVIESCSLKLNSTELALSFTAPLYAEDLQNLIAGSIIGIRDLTYYKTEFEENLSDLQEQKFGFKIFKYHPLQVCASALSSPLSTSEANSRRFMFQEKAWNSFFINVVPQPDNLYVIIGFHKEHTSNWLLSYIESWNTEDKIQQQNNLTELFATRIMVWAMSKTLFKTIKNDKIRQFENYWNRNFNNLKTNQRLGFNLFD
jgi:hypothetical protein